MLHTNQRAASIDGTLSELDQAVVPLSDRGFLFGEAVIEVMKVHGGRLENYDTHVERLMRGCEEFGIEPKFEHAVILEEIRSLYQYLEQPRTAYLKVIVTSGQGITLRRPADLIPSLYIFMTQMEDICAKPIIATSLETNQTFSSFKTNHMGWRTLDMDQNENDILYMDPLGSILCLSKANIFFVDEEGTIHTPALGNILKGTTRSVVLEAIQKCKLKFIERSIRINELNTFASSFATSSIRGITRIGAIDNIGFVGTENPILQRHYKESMVKRSVPL